MGHRRLFKYRSSSVVGCGLCVLGPQVVMSSRRNQHTLSLSYIRVEGSPISLGGG